MSSSLDRVEDEYRSREYRRFNRCTTALVIIALVKSLANAIACSIAKGSQATYVGRQIAGSGSANTSNGVAQQ
jgi:hypothetical protein